MKGWPPQKIDLAWGALEGTKQHVDLDATKTVLDLLNSNGVPRVTPEERKKRDHYLAFPVVIGDSLALPDVKQAVLFSLRPPKVKTESGSKSGVISRERAVFNLFLNDKEGTASVDLESVRSKLGTTVIARNIGAVGEGNTVRWNSPNQLHLARVALSKIVEKSLTPEQFCQKMVETLDSAAELEGLNPCVAKEFGMAVIQPLPKPEKSIPCFEAWPAILPTGNRDSVLAELKSIHGDTVLLSQPGAVKDQLAVVLRSHPEIRKIQPDQVEQRLKDWKERNKESEEWKNWKVTAEIQEIFAAAQEFGIG